MMNYQETIETYKPMFKKYPGMAGAFYYRPLMKEVSFIKSGNKWIETERTERFVESEVYYNVISAVPFFRNLGGYERVSMSYTYAGYIPVEVVSISPDRTKKALRTFTFYKS